MLQGSVLSPAVTTAHRMMSAPPVTLYQPSVATGPDRAAKLRADLGTVQQNCRVFGEILTELSSGNGTPDDVELLEVFTAYLPANVLCFTQHLFIYLFIFEKLCVITADPMFLENFTKDVSLGKEELLIFWKSSGSIHTGWAHH